MRTKGFEGGSGMDQRWLRDGQGWIRDGSEAWIWGGSESDMDPGRASTTPGFVLGRAPGSVSEAQPVIRAEFKVHEFLRVHGRKARARV